MKGLPAIDLHIERVVIDGVALTQAQAHQLRGALEQELTRLLRDDARCDWQQRAAPGITAPAVDLTTPVRPLDLGRAIARSVHASLAHDA